MQRKCVKGLESRLAAKNEENTTLSRNLDQMETAHKQIIDKHRYALGRAVKKCGVAIVFSGFSDQIIHIATLRSNPSWTI